MPGINFTFLRELEDEERRQREEERSQQNVGVPHSPLSQRQRELLDRAASLMHNGGLRSEKDRETFDRLMAEAGHPMVFERCEGETTTRIGELNDQDRAELAKAEASW